MASGHGVSKPDKANHPNRQVGGDACIVTLHFHAGARNTVSGRVGYDTCDRSTVSALAQQNAGRSQQQDGEPKQLS